MIPIKPEDREWLVPELYRRAARCYEKAGMWKEAQRCWQKAGDPAHTAPLLLSEKRYAAGLEMYRAWLSGLASGDGMGEVQARLGVAACLKGMQRDPEAQGEYRIARNLVEQRAGGDPAIAAGCWEALGAYGARVGRSDLIQVGYEQALELYERERSSEWVRVAQEYRVAASVNRLLVADIERRLSDFTQPEKPREWPGDLWRACWNSAGWIDFTAPAWANLSYAEHVRYAKAYQEWYAARKKLEIAKKMPVGNTSMILRLIPPGRFIMGSPASEPERYGREVQHLVLISKPFYLGQHEVTQAQWEAVMGNNPSYFKGDANLPVESVSWEECQDFCQKTGLALPSEAQWEYACRAGTLTPFNLGENITSEVVNYDDNYPYANGAKGVCRGKTVPVGSLPNANAWGCYDFHGNVYEWCSDWYGDYPTEEVEDPKGSANGSARVDRGGCWGILARRCRSAYRNYRAPDYRGDRVGVRLQVIIAGF